MISSISTEYSEDEFVDSVLQFLPQPKEDLNMERNNIMNELVEYMSDECNSNQNTNAESEYESNVEREENNHSDEHNYHTCSCHVPQKLQYAVDLIESKETMVPLIKEMDKVGLLDDFLLMLQLILKGSLEANNIPLTLSTELAKLKNCDSTTGIRYNKNTLDFWLVFYRTCHASGLNLMSGSKHYGHVTGNLTEKGKYGSVCRVF